MTMRVVRIVAMIAVSAVMLLAVASAPSTLAAGADGWSVVYRYPHESSALAGIDVRIPSDVWAVGGHQGRRGSEVVLVRSNGRSWWSAPSWQPASGYASLSDVAALERNLGWAVGQAPNGALVLRWNGTRWGRVAVPDGGTTSAQLSAVDRVKGLRALWAVGSSRSRALILRWNGTRWRRTPVPGLLNARLNDVYSVSRTTAYAVGEAGGFTLIIRWHRGDGWRVLDHPVYVDGRFEGVAVSRGRVVVVGYLDGPLLVERTDDGWHEVAWTWPGETFSLRDVDGVRGEFWVIGDRYLQDGRIRPFVLRGREGWWRDVRVPAPGPFSGLSAVAAGRTWIWATGHDGEGESITGFVMRGGASP